MGENWEIIITIDKGGIGVSIFLSLLLKALVMVADWIQHLNNCFH